ncbi:MAG: glycoside hydrolase family 3 C-terminal domain-containing protein, partial [Clostridia bacterium]|nr:glycoside hydrolase family 3 C-terminal domain-containing protein [Clostridia bacterium]
MQKYRTLSGSVSDAPQPWEAGHAALAREAAEEGIVLLRNEGVLPLSKGSRVALFGAGASHTVKGGTGSGDVNERHSTTIEEGMREAGFVITTDSWLRRYDERFQAERCRWRDRIYEKMAAGNRFFMAYSSTPFHIPAGDARVEPDPGTDTAVYVISRIAGEGADRTCEPGDYLLSAEEREVLGTICAVYEKVIVIINAGGVMDLSFLEEYPAIRGLLIVSQPGMAGGTAVARVLSGAVCPSGHLTDTWAYRYADYPSSAHFSQCDGAGRTRYEEGIYVGYRYFDTFSIPVRYGFGEGLSYTDFSLCSGPVQCTPDRVTVQVEVENTGHVAGRAVIQLYVQLPFGKLEKEARRLAAFAKSPQLAPGARTVLTLSFETEALTSYDPAIPGWVLEKGLYGLYVGLSLRESRLVACLEVGEEVLVQQTGAICPLRETLRELHQPEGMAGARYRQLTEAACSVPCIAFSPEHAPAVPYTEPEPDREAAEMADRLT